MLVGYDERPQDVFFHRCYSRYIGREHNITALETWSVVEGDEDNEGGNIYMLRT